MKIKIIIWNIFISIMYYAIIYMTWSNIELIRFLYIIWGALLVGLIWFLSMEKVILKFKNDV